MRQKLQTKNATKAPTFNGGDRRGITITPLRGFLLTLLCLSIPTVSLGTACLALAKNNLQLNEKNEKLDQIAFEVKAEVDSLGEEIEDLREWVDTELEVPLPQTVATEAKADSESSPDTSNASSVATYERSIDKESASRNFSRSNASQVSKDFPPKGGPAQSIDSLALLEGLSQQVPTLNQTLDSQVKPAVEEAIAKEAAYPNGTPVVGKIEVSSEYGIRSNPFGGGGYEMHEGIDFVGKTGDVIVAAGDGVVAMSGHNGGYGIVVTIDHKNGYESLYAHMSKASVEVGESVQRGDVIGYIGSTGRSSGPHLHYSLYKDKQAINPRQLLKLAD
ncbi:M23 peptidase domain protein [Synechococcus sp. PCC 7335]|uniref:M23 family metallopeptidase n=1 Tax=Synechococcus sp. (strain ATCC 29403 / PCC 7335) TaxID=91464 RepID=UPI00017ECAE3|nr:M23 family metallopeptidase [Synechococcus sp. PCC 7335]EDX84729.1 M23 peptidase domain protein [Synechococcus sp. PCC 7335]